MSHDDVMKDLLAEIRLLDESYEPPKSLSVALDSLKIMAIVVWIEGRYGFEVEIDDIVPENFDTPDALAAYIERKRAP